MYTLSQSLSFVFDTGFIDEEAGSGGDSDGVLVSVETVLPHAKFVAVKNILLTATTDKKGIKILFRKKPAIICVLSGTMYKIQANAYK